MKKLEDIAFAVFTVLVLIFLACLVTGFVYLTWNLVTSDYSGVSTSRVVVRCPT